MQSENKATHTKTYFDLPEGVIIEYLLTFLKECLISFKEGRLSLHDSKELQDAPENFYAKELVNYLFDKQRENEKRKIEKKDKIFVSFNFINQDDSGDKIKTRGIKPTMDIRVYLPYQPKHIFDIEAKRLYDKNLKTYVVGRTGGIERFKRNSHGQGLNQCAILGYIEIENFNFWHDKINTWLKEESAKASDLNWIDEEMLKDLTIVAENLTESLSLHGRIDNAPIKLIHLWVDLIDR